MTDLPYTEDDLLIEAARQHVALTEDPDFGVVGEQMDDDEWRSLSAEEFDIAQRRIHGLINAAADVSEWAIHLGADGLEPSNDHAITIQGNGRPIARIHFAFEPDMPEEMRTLLVEGIGDEIAKNL